MVKQNALLPNMPKQSDGKVILDTSVDLHCTQK